MTLCPAWLKRKKSKREENDNKNSSVVNRYTNRLWKMFFCAYGSGDVYNIFNNRQRRSCWLKDEHFPLKCAQKIVRHLWSTLGIIFDTLLWCQNDNTTHYYPGYIIHEEWFIRREQRSKHGRWAVFLGNVKIFELLFFWKHL